MHQRAKPVPKDKKDKDKIEIEPGADKRLANILKKALNTPPARSGKKAKPDKRRSS